MKLKWNWTGHIIRGNEKWTRAINFWYPNCKRKKNRPFKRWRDDIGKLEVIYGQTCLHKTYMETVGGGLCQQSSRLWKNK